jgi:aryl-alcohol dehydrogenase
VPKRLELAMELGATATINASKEDVVARLKEMTGGAGIDYAIEATGVSPSIKSAFSALANGSASAGLASENRLNLRAAAT